MQPHLRVFENPYLSIFMAEVSKKAIGIDRIDEDFRWLPLPSRIWTCRTARAFLSIRRTGMTRLHDQVDGDRKVYPALQRLWES